MGRIYLFSTFLVFTLVGCFSQKKHPKLTLVKSVQLPIKEPSGITTNNTSLFIVSDKTGSIFEVSFNGELIREIKSKLKDLEGIAFEFSTNSFWVVSESSRKLIQLNFSGKVLQKHKIKGEQHRKNNGLEGVCFEPNNTLVCVNEKQPKQLLKLNKAAQITKTLKLKFGNDISGICYDAVLKCFWVVSDESQKVYQITQQGKKVASYSIAVKKPEGIILYKNRIFIVSDYNEKLYIFKKPE